MIDSIIKIADRLIQLLTIRKENRRALFKDHIEPIFSDLSKVHQDYLRSCQDLISYIERIDERQLSHYEIEKLIKNYKINLEPKRVEIHSIAKSVKKNVNSKKISDELKSFYDYCSLYFANASSDYSLMPKSFRTMFDVYSGFYSNLIEYINKASYGQREFSKNSLLNHLTFQESQLRWTWSKLSETYAELRIKLLQ